jgi:hypothetical protein
MLRTAISPFGFVYALTRSVTFRLSSVRLERPQKIPVPRTWLEHPPPRRKVRHNPLRQLLRRLHVIITDVISVRLIFHSVDLRSAVSGKF